MEFALMWLAIGCAAVLCVAALGAILLIELGRTWQ